MDGVMPSIHSRCAVVVAICGRPQEDLLLLLKTVRTEERSYNLYKIKLNLGAHYRDKF
jgi:hypothetical protein